MQNLTFLGQISVKKNLQNNSRGLRFQNFDTSLIMEERVIKLHLIEWHKVMKNDIYWNEKAGKYNILMLKLL